MVQVQNRKHICFINGKASIAREVGLGVPQGYNLSMFIGSHFTYCTYFNLHLLRRTLHECKLTYTRT